MLKIVAVDTDVDDDFLALEEKLVKEAGMDFQVFHERSAESIIKNAADADGVITSYGNFPKEVFEALPNLRVVSRTGVGYDTIDMDAATKHGVAVCNVPGYATEVVSDHAIALALAVLRRIVDLDVSIREGKWDYEAFRPYGQVYGRTFGVVGMGHIGRAVARKANGLGFRVVCSSHSLAPGDRTPEGYDVLSYEDLLKQADVVSFHTALTPTTRHMLDAEKLSLMKDDAIVINTSRGAVVDTAALAKALSDGKLFGAGIDVFEEEPIAADDPLLKAPRTILTPHAAYWSEESGRELITRATMAAITVVQGKSYRDVLNPQVYDSPAFKAKFNK